MLNSLKSTYESGKGLFVKGTAMLALILALSACHDDKWKDNKELANTYTNFNATISDSIGNRTLQNIKQNDGDTSKEYTYKGGYSCSFTKEINDKLIQYDLGMLEPKIMYNEFNKNDPAGKFIRTPITDTAQIMAIYKELADFINAHR